MFDPKYPERDPNKRSAKEIWEERYGQGGYLFGKEPALVLKNHVAALKKGKALDVAMGEGRNAVFLAQNGFQVQGLDASPKAVEKAKALAAERGVPIDAKVQNLDFYLMPLMGFDTIVMSYFRPLPRFFSEIRRGLAMGGTLALEAYTVEHYKTQSPPSPVLDFEDCYKPNEVLGHLKDFHLLYYKEMREGQSHLVQAIAQKIR